MKMALSYPSYASMKAIVTGYGWNNGTVKLKRKNNELVVIGSSDWKLRFAEAKIINNTECTRLYDNIETISRENICTKMGQSRYDVGHGTCNVSLFPE